MSLEMKSVKFTYKKINKKENRKFVSNYVKNYITDPKEAKRILKNMDNLVPYVDYYPIKILPSAKATNITGKTLEEMMIEDSPFKTWDDLGEMARPLYDTKEEALEILLKGSRLFKLTDDNTYMLCGLLEAEKKKKQNKGKALRAIIESVFDQCCTFCKIDPTRVNPSKRTAKKENLKMNSSYRDREQVIDSMVEKHRRLIIKRPKDFRDWMNSRGLERIKFYKKNKK
jgi:hypothetical protein